MRRQAPWRVRAFAVRPRPQERCNATVDAAGALPTAGTTRVFRYAAAGGAATGVHYAVLAALVWSGLPAPAATASGSAVGALVHYGISARHVFGQDMGTRSAATFAGVALLTAALNAGLVWCWHNNLGFALAWAQLGATAVSFAFSFVLNDLWTFAGVAPVHASAVGDGISCKSGQPHGSQAPERQESGHAGA